MTSGLNTPLGEPGSGRRRYGAVMALHRAGQISDAVLEVYRVCSASDRQDPEAVLAALHLPKIAPAPVSRADLLQPLLSELDLYIARKSGPGLAELRAAIARAGLAADPTPRPTNAPPQLAKALDALAQTHPALAAALGAAMPSLHWSRGAVDATLLAPLIGKAAPFASDDTQLSLYLIPQAGDALGPLRARPTLFLPLNGPLHLHFPPAMTLISKPAHRPFWIDADRLYSLQAKDDILFGLIAYPLRPDPK